ncbi:mannosyl-glycoprotein endo-beta-N-acetylglucosaminidase [Apostasia shenzhenica]|uniref:mannosyl-glycoprotein endo-beta-N-acetylglucosaminidase n=1 Tax=Apostasia shenzhenica TaxID=1088818 RepID=A0A2I0AKU9_9ASPA|nr:mannosyl-glycoprotein endo-beta-N-acetylglucosaminidase [Apostasia shenzhenica]
MAAPSDPTKPSFPVSYPITDLETLLSRSYFDSFHYPFNVSSVPLPASSVEMPTRRRILVCHDFKGGYTDDDKFVQGSSNASAYAIWHWHLMDVFVYFSHNLVSLPPPGWTNAAHTHGVKILATFITEWDKGREICNTLLSTTKSSRTYAERLAELAYALGFDGWLLNMEVKLDQQQLANLKEFVGHLTQSMHKLVPGSLVIWYDSVTVDGTLTYQNQLNEKNKLFFDLCDGIFCNYKWKEYYAIDSVTVAGDRRFDVYMGIDVWGRGTFGGGQWNTNLALDVLKKVDVSAAIFAPGWVYETAQKPNFQTAQNRWWGLVEESWGVLQNYPRVLPFYSNFDQGHGFHYSIGGLEVLNSPWNNISCEGFQPVLYCMENSPTSMQVFINFEDVPYVGGGSIMCRGTLGNNGVFSTRLFLGCLSSEQPLSFTYYVKADGNSLVGLCLSFSSNPEETEKVLLVPEAIFPAFDLTSKYDKVIVSQNGPQQDPSLSSGWVKYDSTIMMSGHTLTEVGLLCYFKKPDKLKTDLRRETNSPISNQSPFSASLGLIRIRVTGENAEFPSADSWTTEGKNISWSFNDNGAKAVSLQITWKLNTVSAESFLLFNIYVQRAGDAEFLGVTRAGMYYVSALEVPSGITRLSFIIQVCGLDGSSQDLDKCPTHLLSIEV